MFTGFGLNLHGKFHMVYASGIYSGIYAKSGNRVKNIRPIFSLLTGERCYRCRISRQARAYLSSEGASYATELLSHNAGGVCASCIALV